ncbi:hypothetical protein H4R19_005462, partial [Coemansia spiralis]
PKTQSTNPACPNYVPPGQANSDTSAIPAPQGYFDSGAPADTRATLVPVPMPAAPEPATNVQPVSSPAYQLEPLPALLPTPTNGAVLAASEVKQPAAAAPAPVLGVPAKCTYATQAPLRTDVIIQGLPPISSVVAVSTAMALPEPTQMRAPVPAPAVPVPVWDKVNWYQASAPPRAALPAPAAADMVFATTIESTQTFYIPEGADGVFFGTRNVGAYQFGA